MKSTNWSSSLINARSNAMHACNKACVSVRALCTPNLYSVTFMLAVYMYVVSCRNGRLIHLMPFQWLLYCTERLVPLPITCTYLNIWSDLPRLQWSSSGGSVIWQTLCCKIDGKLVMLTRCEWNVITKWWLVLLLQSISMHDRASFWHFALRSYSL